MDNIPKLKLTPLEQSVRISGIGDNSRASLKQIDEAESAGGYQISDELRRVLEKSPRSRLGGRVRSFASSSAARLRGITSRRPTRGKTKRRSATVRTRTGDRKERPPFLTTFQGQIAVCSGVILLALALKAVDTPKTQAVSATVEQAITTETNLDQNLGRLQFVQNMFSESVAVFWQKAPETLQSPFNGRVSAKYSLAAPGIEITGKSAEVYACYDGRVTAVDVDDEGNVAVIVQHSGGLETVYARMSQADVKVKDKVKKGDVLGTAQEKGEGFAMFLQVRLDDVTVDPLPYFQK